MPKIQVFWECYAVSPNEVSKDRQAKQEPGLNLDCLILKTALMSYETSRTTRPTTTQRHIPENLHLRKNFFFKFFLIW